MTERVLASTIVDLAQNSLKSASAAVLALESVLDGDSFLDCVRVVDECDGHVYVTGTGASGSVATRLSHLLRTVGTRCSFLSPSDALHGGLGGVKPDDVLVVVSKGGQTAELIETVASCVARGTTVIALTSAVDSRLATMADHTLLIPMNAQWDHGGALGTASGIAQAALGDALAIGVLTRRGNDWQSVADAHPAGMAGVLLRGKLHDDDGEASGASGLPAGGLREHL